MEAKRMRCLWCANERECAAAHLRAIRPVAGNLEGLMKDFLPTCERGVAQGTDRAPPALAVSCLSHHH